MIAGGNDTFRRASIMKPGHHLKSGRNQQDRKSSPGRCGRGSTRTTECARAFGAGSARPTGSRVKRANALRWIPSTD